MGKTGLAPVLPNTLDHGGTHDALHHGDTRYTSAWGTQDALHHGDTDALHHGDKCLSHLNHFGVQALSQLTATMSQQNRAIYVDVDQSSCLGETNHHTSLETH